MRKSTHVYKKFNCAYFLIFCVAIQSINLNSATIIVTSEADSGTDTLRDAITNAGDGDTIVFAPDVNFISLLSPLPEIDQFDLTIDGLAQVFNSEIIPGDCDTFPSPVDDQELFSAALRITIDGSKIPKDTPNRGVGLNIQRDRVSIAGLRIQNFNGRITDGSSDLDAVGIFALSGIRSLPTIECCKITNIIGGTSSSPNFVNSSGKAFGIENASLVDKSLIQNITSLSTLDNNKTKIEESGGIKNSETITNCVIQKIERGSISSSEQIVVQPTSGISSDNNVNFSQMTIQNCIIQNICGGSIKSTNTEETTILIDSVSGIFIDPFSLVNTIINNVTICNINAGTIEVNGSDITIKTEPVMGIRGNIQTNIEDVISISNSCITCINGYDITISGENNNFFYPRVIAIDASSLNNTIQNNNVDTINGNNITITGDCNRVLLDNFGSLSSPLCIPQIPFSVIGIHVLNFHDNQNNILQSNNIKKIGGAQYAINGNKSSLLSGGSAGINVQNSQPRGIPSENVTTLITDNTIVSITGPTHTLQPDSLHAMQLNGTTGIHVESFITRISNNSIKNIHEGSMRAASHNPLALYGLPLNLDFNNILPPVAVPFLPVYTSGITAVGTNGSDVLNMDGIVIKDNTITSVKGSLVQGGAAALGSYSTGIIAQPSLEQVLIPTLKQASQSFDFIGIINNNIINNVHAQSKAAGYGIFIDGSNILIESAIVFQATPFVDSKLKVQENTISSVTGVGTVTPITIDSSQLRSPVCGSEQIPAETLLIPFLPSEPTSGIFALFGGDSTLRDNNIFDVHAPLTRGITTVASSDMYIVSNDIFKTDGPGIFVGGASVNPILITSNGAFTQQEFEQFFPSVRNKIYSNSTYANTGEGIELGVINWNDFFSFVPLLNCGPALKTTMSAKGGPIETIIIGNHDQPAPHIMRVVCNRNGTITIEVKFSDPNHPSSEFIIQFFRNSSNDVPHGEQLISNFDNPQFIFSTNANGNARNKFTFVPAAQVELSDIISAHVTLTVDGSIGSIGSESEDIGDTSEFRMQVTASKDPACHLQKHPAPRQFCYGR